MILYLTTADTDLLTLRAALEHLPGNYPPVRAANLTDWLDNDEAARSFLDRYLQQAQIIILRALGGRKAQPYAFDRIRQHCQTHNLPLLAWPGDPEPDPELDEASTVDIDLSKQAMAYALYGGVDNFSQMLLWISNTWLDTDYSCKPPAVLPWAGIYVRGETRACSAEEWQADLKNQAEPLLSPEEDLLADDRRKPEAGRKPVIAVLFYRAHWMSRNVSFVDDLCSAIEQQGAIALPVFAQSLKEDAGKPQEGYSRFLKNRAGRPFIDALIVTMSFSTHSRGKDVCPPGNDTPDAASIMKQFNVPVFQALVSLHSQEKWKESTAGLSPLDTAMNVALPEFDGRIITVPVCFKETDADDPVLETSVRRYQALADRCDYVARLAIRWSRLAYKDNSNKKIAFMLNNSPSKNSRIGNGVGLDTANSIVKAIHELAANGYDVGDPANLPATGDELIHQVIATCSNDRDYLTEEQLRQAVGRLPAAAYASKWSTISGTARQQVADAWGPPPGDIFLYDNELIMPGVQFGHIFVGLQPPRGFGDNPSAIYHSPDLVPTHHYIGYYRFLRDHFQADAVIHLGKHGTLEWLPGKGIGLSDSCFPEVVLDDLPHFYPYIINNPGEGTQAKRRGHAVIIDHMVPVMTTADTYDELSRIELLLEEYYQVQLLDPKKLPVIQQEIWEKVQQAKLDQDLQQTEFPEQFGLFLKKIDGYICELKSAQIRDGLHILGQVPGTVTGWTDMLYSLVQHPNGKINSLPSAIAEAMRIDWSQLKDQLGEPWEHQVPALLYKLDSYPRDFHPRRRDIKEAVEELARQLLRQLVMERSLELLSLRDEQTEQDQNHADSRDAQFAPGAVKELKTNKEVAAVMKYVEEVLLPKLLKIPDELGHLLKGLEGGFVPPGPSGAPTRGMADILPTGRNFYSVDPAALPSSSAWRVGQQLAEELIRRYKEEENRYPESVAVVVWGTSAMRTRGDDVAQILALLGVRPVWQASSARVTGLEVIPLEELQRPRVDVTVRISGFFRDAFPHLVKLMNDAVEMVSRLDEPAEQNPLRHRVLEETAQKMKLGLSEEEARESAAIRVFGSKPGTYGAGLLSLIESGSWQTDADIAEVFTQWSSYAYTNSHYGKPAAADFRHRLRLVQVAAKNQDNREHDIFDSDDYFQEHGGMVATIRSLTGRNPKMYFGDSSNPSHIRVRDLKEEALRVFRSRVINPKWLESAKRHGYKGALEMANTTDFLFGYDATAHVIEDWMYEKVSEQYVLNEDMRQFLLQSNPWALKDIAERLLEAASRKLWENPDPHTIEGLMNALLETDNALEEGGSDQL
ncbi:cobaltochelatase subunit CobN [Paenibacillus senegalensis]|uniref:cobaltochelatase subunit CobN n=1 Tax=Paenibacillus senegalensis TaxID=1465766 RepID=UPI000288C3C8|nr:cobaltochelatase subunit CobN [Paenibacillus senegalensis]